MLSLDNGPKQEWFWTRSFVAASMGICECGGPCCSTCFNFFGGLAYSGTMLRRDVVACC